MNYTNTHKEIVESCRRNERSGQFKLYDLYAKAMYNVCLRMLNNREDAEDMLQNVFLEVFSKLDQFRYESSIGAWIKRITVNRCINFLKKKRIEWITMEDQKLPVVVEEENFVDIKLSVEKIRRAIPLLPDGYRLVFTLYMLEGYDHREIAEILSINEATSKSQLNRAKKKLKQLINNEQKIKHARPS